ncbi:MAG: hypothetical protein U9R32_04375, partial [Bacteroidota bacterium]|nr:hypothetical protein [Bacteroidota bacterium]
SIAKGNNILLLLSSNNKKTNSKEIIIKGVDAFENPEWSPNNDKIVFTGLANGQSDLYLYDISENSTVQLTDDPYSDLQPSWSADGEKIIFISERGDDTDFSKPVFGKYRITELDVKSEKIKSYNNILPESDIFNVHYAEGDSAVYFLSHADGYRNLYKYNFFTDSLFRLTNYNTGISGITDLAPAFSISRQGKIAYTLFNDDGYHIYIANINDFSAQAIKKDFYSNDAEKLAPQKRKSNIVAINLKQYPFHYSIKTEKKKYSPHFGLEHLGSTSIGMATGYHERYASGGVTALFGDVLHRHQISGGIMIQGEIYDIGGAATYINNENRISWGVSASHIPYRYSQYYLLDRTIIEMNNQYHEVQDLIERRIRIFQDKATLFASLPFNQKTRVECGAYYTRYGYRIDSINNYYSMQGDYMKRNEHKVNAPNNDFIGRVYAAFVFDNVDMGITSPLHGSRFRFQLDQSFSDLKMYSGLIDYRKYHYFKPFSVGLRLLHHARFGDDSENIYPLYLGQSYYIRGYEYGSFANELSDNLQQTIIGSKMGLLNLELRLPLTGPERLSQIKSKYFFSDIVLFVDGGFSTYDYNNLNFSWNPNYKKNNIVFSTGMAVRINLFGFAVLEPYIAHPFQRNDKKMVFGLFIKGMDW